MMILLKLKNCFLMKILIHNLMIQSLLVKERKMLSLNRRSWRLKMSQIQKIWKVLNLVVNKKVVVSRPKHCLRSKQILS